MKTILLISFLASIFITAIHGHERQCSGIHSGVAILGNESSVITCDLNSCSFHNVLQCVSTPKIFIFRPLLKRLKTALKS